MTALQLMISFIVLMGQLKNIPMSCKLIYNVEGVVNFQLHMHIGVTHLELINIQQ